MAEGERREEADKTRGKKETLSLAGGGIARLVPSDIFSIVAAEMPINTHITHHTQKREEEEEQGLDKQTSVISYSRCGTSVTNKHLTL